MLFHQDRPTMTRSPCRCAMSIITRRCGVDCGSHLTRLRYRAEVSFGSLRTIGLIPPSLGRSVTCDDRHWCQNFSLDENLPCMYGHEMF